MIIPGIGDNPLNDRWGLKQSRIPHMKHIFPPYITHHTESSLMLIEMICCYSKGLKCEITTFLSSHHPVNPAAPPGQPVGNRSTTTYTLSVISQWLAGWLEPAPWRAELSVRLKGGTFLISKNTSVNLHYLSYSFLPAVWVNDTWWELVHLVNHRAQCLNKPSELLFSFRYFICPRGYSRCGLLKRV